MYIFLCVYIYIYMSLSIYTCIYVYVYYRPSPRSRPSTSRPPKQTNNTTTKSITQRTKLTNHINKHTTNKPK